MVPITRKPGSSERQHLSGLADALAMEAQTLLGKFWNEAWLEISDFSVISRTSFVSEFHCTCSFSVWEPVMCGNRQTTNSWQEAWLFYLDARKWLVAKETFVYQWEIPKPPISWFFSLRYRLGHLKLFLLVFNPTFISSILTVCLLTNQFYPVGQDH